jgi:hypothetical protein
MRFIIVHLRSQFISGIMFPVQFFIGNLAYIAIAVVGHFWFYQPIQSLRLK